MAGFLSIDTRRPHDVLDARGRLKRALVRRILRRLAVLDPVQPARNPNSQAILCAPCELDPIDTHSCDIDQACELLDTWASYWIARNQAPGGLLMQFDRYSDPQEPLGCTATFRYREVPEGNVGLSTCTSILRLPGDEYRLLPDGMSANLPPYSLYRMDHRQAQAGSRIGAAQTPSGAGVRRNSKQGATARYGRFVARSDLVDVRIPSTVMPETYGGIVTPLPIDDPPETGHVDRRDLQMRTPTGGSVYMRTPTDGSINKRTPTDGSINRRTPTGGSVDLRAPTDGVGAG